jgi:hypothetical protein
VAGRAGEDRPHREDRARRGGAVERRGRGRLLSARRVVALAVVALASAACRRPAPPPPTPEPAPPLIAESTLPPSGTPHFEIGPITPTRSSDGSEWLVESSVRNTGTRTSRDIRVRVYGLDDNGVRLARTELSPEQQEIPPGGAATFVAHLPGDAAIRTVDVEAVGR